MNYRIFSLPATGDETAEQNLNAFMVKHKVVQVDRQFVAQGDLSYWSLCVCYQSVSTASPAVTAAKKARIDYKEVLNESQFAHFAALRELRKQMAEQDGVPVFAVFTNDQLAKMVQQDVLINLLRRQFKGEGLLSLFSRLLESFSANGTGLPIGALTSQYFANHYLDGYQRWLRNCSQTQDELRYMDDVLVFCDSLKAAKVIVDESSHWLTAQRRLVLKPAIIQYSRVGVTFCGFHVSAKGIKMGQRRKRSYKDKLELLLYQVENDLISPTAAQVRANLLASLCLPGQHLHWQKKQLEQRYAEPWQIEL